MRIVEAVEEDFLRRVIVLTQHRERRLHHAELGVMDEEAGRLAADDLGGIWRSVGKSGAHEGGRDAGGQAGRAGHQAEFASIDSEA